VTSMLARRITGMFCFFLNDVKRVQVLSLPPDGICYMQCLNPLRIGSVLSVIICEK
jgi:hypothetical protein